MTSRDFQETTILIPGYSIEDIPTDLSEAPAASLLNAFAVAWHPQLLVRSGGIPQFRQADSTEMPTARQIILVPQCSEEWLGHDWQNQLADTLSLFISDCSSREEWLEAIRTQFSLQDDVPPELLNPFFSLGTCYVQVMLLSRKMHYFVDPDTYVLESEAVAAATAAIAGDSETMQKHLQRCFECLLECREQFQPTDCYLIDMCLPSDQNSADELHDVVSHSPNLTLVSSAQELKSSTDTSPELTSAIRQALDERRLSLMVGHYHELRTSLGSLSTLYSDVNTAQQWLHSLGEPEHFHWARRRFGLCSIIPAVVSLFELRSALHVALDDGIYPDREQGQMQWQAADGTAVQAVSRIPMAIDGASSFLRFADRFTESMQEDSAAVMLLARLPQVQTPWLQDLRIAATYAPVLGSFVTMTEYADLTGGQSNPTQYDDGEYLSPFLIQSSVLKTEAPISSPATLHQLRSALESIATMNGVSAILRPTDITRGITDNLELRLNDEEAARIGFEANSDAQAQAESVADFQRELRQLQQAQVDRLLKYIPSKESAEKGLFIFNPLPWKRRRVIHWPAEFSSPAAMPSVVEAREQDGTRLLMEVPAGGFAWVTEAKGGKSPVRVETASRGKPLAEELLLRNQIFELQISQNTGGIASVTFHNQRGNRVSQQLAFRYEQSRTFVVDEQEKTTSYAGPQLVSSRVTQSGPMIGEIEVTGQITDLQTGDVLTGFRQTVTVERDSARIQLRIDFDDIRKMPNGNPWMTYYASRFAWENEAASITRGMLGQARGFRMERFEAADYVEIADSDTRLVIVPHGRPYHRRSGHRMLDSLLVVEGETERSFQFTLEFDQNYPMRVASEVQQPLIVSDVAGRRPSGADTGWILGTSAKNIIIARLRCVGTESEPRITLLLEETEGRAARCLIRTARKPKTARRFGRDGSTVEELAITDSGVEVEFGRFQIREVELGF